MLDAGSCCSNLVTLGVFGAICDPSVVRGAGEGRSCHIEAAGGPDFTPDSSSQFSDTMKLASLATSSISGSNCILDANIIGWTALRGFRSCPAGTPKEVGTTAPTFVLQGHPGDTADT